MFKTNFIKSLVFLFLIAFISSCTQNNVIPIITKDKSSTFLTNRGIRPEPGNRETCLNPAW